MKRLWRILLWLIGIITVLIISIVLAFKISVKPGIFIIQHMFNQPVSITDEARYEKADHQIKKLENITYTSSHGENILDIYYPHDGKVARPILFWVHGGGYVGGNKEGVKEFATYIAASNQVAVVAMNYEKAPYLQYPGQVKQVEEVYRYLREHQVDYPMLDFSNVLFGGDSAGAQIAAQYVALQTNEAYANEMAFEQIVPQKTIRAFISLSGPVDLKQMGTIHTDEPVMKFFVNTVARALIGKKDWKDSMEIRQGSVKDYITEQFPPTYITDGNAYSFQEQGMAFVERLKTLNIPVQSLFFDKVEHEIPHEYQFDYTLDEAKESLQQTIDFINEQLHN